MQKEIIEDDSDTWFDSVIWQLLNNSTVIIYHEKKFFFQILIDDTAGYILRLFN